MNTSDVTCLFVLGCNQCSETLAVVDADKMAGSMNALRTAPSPVAEMVAKVAAELADAEVAVRTTQQNAARYVAWRAAMMTQDQKFIDAMAAALPADVGRSRTPTAEEWDAALDKAAALPAIERAPASTPDWTECERISNLPDVDEALLGFSDDPTSENGVEVVRAVLAAVRSKA